LHWHEGFSGKKLGQGESRIIPSAQMWISSKWLWKLTWSLSFALVCTRAQTPRWPGSRLEQTEQLSRKGPQFTQELWPYVWYRHGWLRPRVHLELLHRAVQTPRCFTNTLLGPCLMQKHSEKIVPDPILSILKDKSEVKDSRWQKPTDAAQTVRCVGIATGTPGHSSFH